MTRPQTFTVGLGLSLLLAGLSPPVDRLADSFLSAHMLQHLLIAIIIPLVLVAGSAGAGTIKNLSGWRCPPLYGWLAAIGLTAIWHMPRIFDFALGHPVVHGLEHVSLLAAGIVFWWPVFGPRMQRLPVIAAVPYLITACMGCTIVGIVIALGPAGMYAAYPYASDQQLAGLIMWVPGCLVYLSSVLWVLGRYYATDETAH